MFFLFPSSHSCMRSLTVWRSSTRMRKRNWRRRGRASMMSLTCSNRKGLQQSSCKTKHNRQGAPPHSSGIKRRKSEYCSLPPVPGFTFGELLLLYKDGKSLDTVNQGGTRSINNLTFQHVDLPVWLVGFLQRFAITIYVTSHTWIPLTIVVS